MDRKLVWNHFKTVTKHRWYVFQNCCYAGIPWQGLKHDLSKYSPIEFFESAKYYTGVDSPVNECRRRNEYSLAWQHHKGHNPHHWEYWLDNLGSIEPTPICMPFKYACELICDYIGAGKAYEGKSWTPASQYNWWMNKRKHVCMHPVIYHFVNKVFWDMKTHSTIYRKYLKKKYLRSIYNEAIYKYS